MPKSMIFDTYSKKAKSHETIKQTNRILGFRHGKCIKNQSKIYAKSMQEKGMQKVWKLMPKCIQHLKHIGKNGIRRLMPKFDTKKIKTLRAQWIFIDLSCLRQCTRSGPWKVVCLSKVGAYGNLQWLCRFGCQIKSNF